MFKSIKSIFKSKESDYWDNADYSQNTNDSSCEENEDEFGLHKYLSAKYIRGIIKNIFYTIPYMLLISVVAIVPLYNKTEMTPSYTIRTVITDRYDGTRHQSISFKDGDKTKRIELSHSPIGRYNIGDSIKVVYGKGCLGITDIMDWEIIEYHEETLEEYLERNKTLSEYGPDVENSLGEYLKARVPKVGKNYEGWTDASFTIDKDGNVSNVKVTTHSKIGEAIHKALTDMGKWVGVHKAGQKEKVKISLAYRLGKPFYLISERIVNSDDGTKLKIHDEFDLSGDNGYAFWSVHEENKQGSRTL